MKTESNDDDGLRRLLREHWPVEARVTRDFRGGVWARIEAARRGPATWAGWLRLHLAGVGGAAAAGLLLAATGGGWLAKAHVGRERERAVANYAASIDPHARVGWAAPVDEASGGRGGEDAS